MLKIENVKKDYESFSLSVSMHVERGRITGLIGRNGAGKSTTFKTALGLVRKEGGSVKVFDKDVERLENSDREKIGVVLGDAGFSSSLTIWDIRKIMKKLYPENVYDDAWFQEKCEEQDLPQKKKIKEFSTGMRAKLKVLLAMSHQASLLILDEPTAGLDAVARSQILDLLRDYMGEDDAKSILISSHISSDLESLCDDFYLIDEGKILLHEETDVLLSDYALLKADSAQYETLDRQYILKAKKESYGYCCLTNQKQFYLENYPEVAAEKGSLDSLLLMMIGGEAV